MRRVLRVLGILMLLGLCAVVVFTLQQRFASYSERADQPKPMDPAFIRLSPAEIATLPVAVRWDAPLGSEYGALTYNAQPFRMTRHLGDDLNGIGGYNSDLGDPVYAAATGRVVYVGEPGTGWGSMVILAHRLPNPQTGELDVVQSLYAHMQTVLVHPDQTVMRGETIATVGTAGGAYWAHLHFEIRLGPYVNPSVGYADAPLNRVSPERFVAEHRGATDELLDAAVKP